MSIESRNTSSSAVPVGVSENRVVGVPGWGGSSDYAFSVFDNRLDPRLLTGNLSSGSQRDAFAIAGRLVVDWTFPTSGIPYVVESAFLPSYTSLVVTEGVTLTVPAGAVVKFGRGGGLDVRGSLVVAGTGDRPATFTSSADDSVGGDTNGDGALTSPEGWGQVRLSYGSSLVASHWRSDFSSGVSAGLVHTGGDAAAIDISNSRVSGGVIASRGGGHRFHGQLVKSNPVTAEYF